FRQPKVELAVAEGSVGDSFLRWALDKAGASPRLDLKAPLRIAARRVAWDAASGLAVDAGVEFNAGPRVGVELGWTPRRLELRRVAIKDAQSDATFSVVVADDLFRVGFAGVLHGQSLAAMRRQAEPRSGRIQGDLRLIVDRERP